MQEDRSPAPKAVSPASPACRDRALRAAAPRCRLPFRRSSAARSQVAGRHAVADRGSYTVRSTIKPSCSAPPKRVAGRPRALRAQQPGAVRGPELNLGEAKCASHRESTRARGGPLCKPAWQMALESARLPLYDVHWAAAVVLEKKAASGEAQGRPARRPDRAAVGRPSMWRQARCTSTT